MTSKLLTITKDVALAFVRQRLIRADELPDLLHNTFNSLRQLVGRAAPPPVETSMPPPPLRPLWKESIQERYIACMECGKRVQQLTMQHLRTHQMTSFSYRKKWGIPPDQPLCSRRVRRQRRQTALDNRPWEGRRD